MKHFIQQNTIKTLLKTSLGLILFFLVIQQGFGQQPCVQCDGTTTSGLFPSAIGRYTKATANYSFAGGIYSEANGQASIAFGNRTYANGANSVVLGMFLKSNSSPAIVLGAGFDENNRLENTVSYSMMIGFGSTKPTFFVGPSSGVNNTGKIGIGNVTDPQAKLHIRADATEEASLRLEPTGSTYNAVVYFTNSGHAVKAKTGGHLTFSTQSTKGFVFEAGNVGIGVASPAEKLDIAGNIKQSAGSSLTTTTVKAADANGLKLFNSSGSGMFVAANGSVGIGVATPAEKLDIAGNIKQSAGSSLTTTTVKAADANGLKLYNSSGSGMFVAANGSVGIGTTNTGTEFKLTVAGGIHARDVKVTLTAGSDHVFGDKHRLAPLSEVEAFVKANKHLPGVAPESEMLQQGLDLGSFQIKLLEKIEELTLYIIAQQKEIEALKAAVGKP